MTGVHQGNLSRNCVVSRLYKMGWSQKLFIIFNDVFQEFFGIFFTAHSGSDNNCIRILNAGFFQCFLSRNRAHFHGFGHSANQSGRNIFLIIRCDSIQQNLRIFGFQFFKREIVQCILNRHAFRAVYINRFHDFEKINVEQLPPNPKELERTWLISLFFTSVSGIRLNSCIFVLKFRFGKITPLFMANSE